MVAVLNLPTGFGMASVHLGGTALPNLATFTFGFATTGGGDTPALAASAILQQLTVTGAPFNVNNTNFSNAATLIDVQVKFGPLATGPEASASSGAVLGNSGGDASAPSIALLVNKLTATGGRRGRGRMFVPGLAESSVGNGGFLATGKQTSLQTAWDQFFAAMTTGTRPLYLLHRHDPVQGQTPVAPTIMTSLQVASLCATQRQRMRR